MMSLSSEGRELKFNKRASYVAIDEETKEMEKLVGYEYTKTFVNMEKNLQMSVEGRVGLIPPLPIKKFKNDFEDHRDRSQSVMQRDGKPILKKQLSSMHKTSDKKAVGFNKNQGNSHRILPEGNQERLFNRTAKD